MAVRIMAGSSGCLDGHTVARTVTALRAMRRDAAGRRDMRQAGAKGNRQETLEGVFLPIGGIKNVLRQP
jgi:hypothetical protein